MFCGTFCKVWPTIVGVLSVLVFSVISPDIRQISPEFELNLLNNMANFAERTFWLKTGRLFLPPGTVLQLTPRIIIPVFRQKLGTDKELNSDFQAQLSIYLDVDDMGVASLLNPMVFGRPPFSPFNTFSRPGASSNNNNNSSAAANNRTETKSRRRPLNSDPIRVSTSNIRPVSTTYFPIYKRYGKPGFRFPGSKKRMKRSIMSLPPPENLPGGERAVLLPRIENFMSSFGFVGRGCMLRAICEIHEFPLQEGYGLFGEMISLFFSISQSAYAESHMPEYLKAEQAGRKGDCSVYKKACNKSIFQWSVEKKNYDD